MIRYNSTEQLSIEEFRTPFEIKLDKNNRWVKLAHLLPWDKLAAVYYSSMCSATGAPAIDARIVIGALIIKHKLKLDDRESIEYIRENPYVQYFLGLSDYSYEDVFDRSLFTHLRYRIGEQAFDDFNCIIIHQAEAMEQPGKQHHQDKKTKKSESSQPVKQSNESENVSTEEASKEVEPEVPQALEVEQPLAITHRGKLLLDATVADQMIAYPTDLGLLNTAREESERIIDELHTISSGSKKPRTYRKQARKQYLQIAQKKNKTKREIRKGIGQQLRYLKRNLKSIHGQLDEAKMLGITSWQLSHRDQKIFFVIQHIYAQQSTMYESRTHSIENRIVNVYQPHVRPIVRGKAKAKVEFGAKLGVSLQNGFARINTFSWEAYNETTDLKKQVAAYYQQNGFYPEAVLADRIYGTRDNRAFLKKLGIRFVGKALGRPPKEQLSYKEKRKQQKELNERNHIEGKFGQGKNGYNLNKIRARQQKTSESWVSCIFFVMNIVALVKLLGKNGMGFLFACLVAPLLPIISVFCSVIFAKKLILRPK